MVHAVLQVLNMALGTTIATAITFCYGYHFLGSKIMDTSAMSATTDIRVTDNYAVTTLQLCFVVFFAIVTILYDV